MDAIQKIEELEELAKTLREGQRYDFDDLPRDMSSAMNDAANAIDDLLHEQATNTAEIANSALNYASLFGELQNAMAEIARLRELLAGCRTVFVLALDNGKAGQYANLETRRGSFIHCVKLMQDLDAALTKPEQE